MAAIQAFYPVSARTGRQWPRYDDNGRREAGDIHQDDDDDDRQRGHIGPNTTACEVNHPRLGSKPFKSGPRPNS